MAERTVPGTDVALTIAGSDSSGGAGIEADLKTFTVLDVFGAAAITAITAQNTTGVKHVLLLDPTIVDQQIDAVAGDLDVRATKTGMLGTAEIVDVVARAVERHNLHPLVVDPVMIAKSGDRLVSDEAMQAMARKLVPLATVLTPNLHEAAALLGRSDPIRDEYGATAAAREICTRLGARACIVKGIRRADQHEGEAVDFVYDGKELQELASAWRETTNTHGSGCTFSAALTAALAKGQDLSQALQTAKAVISEAIRQATSLGHGRSPVNPLAYLKIKP